MNSSLINGLLDTRTRPWRTCRSGLAARLLITALAGLLIAGAVIESADAAPRRPRAKAGEARERNVREARASDKPDRPERPPAQKAEKREEPPVPLHIVISIADQRVTVYGSEGVIATAPVSTGTSSHPTPMGLFTILQKNRYHRSNIYSGAPMPFMQRITWSGVALHEGRLPGYPASHGCIRLPHEFASRLWGITRMGMRVVVARRDAPLVDFSHAALPVPRMLAAPLEANGESTAHNAARPTVIATASAVEGVQAGPTTMRQLNPLQAAEADLATATARVPAALREAEAALRLAGEKSTEARRAVADLAAAEAARASAQRRQEEAARALETATLEGLENAKAAKTEADAMAARTLKQFGEAKADEARLTAEAFEAARAARDAEKAIDKAHEAVKTAKRSLEPISVFVSRKEGKVFVRQAWQEVIERPVTIRSPEQPLGTHLFTAIEYQDGGARVRWKSLTMPFDRPDRDGSRQGGGKGRLARSEPVVAPQPVSDPTAREALERIELPQEVAELWARQIKPGSSLIISDQGLGTETGKYTDFIVQAPR